MTKQTQIYTKKIILSVLVLACFGFKNTLKGNASPFVGTWYSHDVKDILTIKNNQINSLFTVDLSISGSNKYHYEYCKQTNTVSMMCDTSTTLSIDTVQKSVIFAQSGIPSETFYQTPPADNPAAFFLNHDFWQEFVTSPDGTKAKKYCRIEASRGSYSIHSRDTNGNHADNGSLEGSVDTTDPNYPKLSLAYPGESYVRFKATYSLADKTLLINTDRFDNCGEQQTYNY
jgi:hypothetical protein